MPLSEQYLSRAGQFFQDGEGNAGAPSQEDLFNYQWGGRRENPNPYGTTQNRDDMRAYAKSLGLDAAVADNAAMDWANSHFGSFNQFTTEASAPAIIRDEIANRIAAQAGQQRPDALTPEQHQQAQNQAQSVQDNFKAQDRNSQSSLGSFVPMVAVMLATAFGGPAAGGLVSTLTSLASGADPLDAMVKGGFNYLTSGLTGGVDGGGTGAFDAGQFKPSDVGLGGDANGGMIGRAIADTGVSADPTKTLLANAGSATGTMNDASSIGAHTLDSSASTGASGPGGATGATDPWGNPDNAGVQTPPAGGPPESGIIGRILQWGKDNQALAAGGLMAGGGLLKGIGDRANARELMDKRIAGDIAVQNSRTQNQIELEEWKRRFAQGGSYFDALIPFRRSGQAALRRPDGSQVYNSQGLIAGAMNGGG